MLPLKFVLHEIVWIQNKIKATVNKYNVLNYLVLSFYVIVNLPKITLQPLSMTIPLRVNNFNTSLKCGAEGNNLQYVWERLNSTIPSNTNGSNTTTIHFFNISPENSGHYRCKASNNTGFGYSDYAVLQINGM